MENKKKPKNNYNISSTNLLKPKKKRRTNSRKTLSNCLINFAEARKEIANALRYHHKRSFLDDKIGSLSTKSPKVAVQEEAQLQREIGPSWVKTEGPVVAVAGPTPSLETLEFSDDEGNFDNDASYSWWVGFLESLDGKNDCQELVRPMFDDGPELLGQAHDLSYDISGSSSSLSSEEWLEILNSDDDCDVMCGLDRL